MPQGREFVGFVVRGPAAASLPASVGKEAGRGAIVVAEGASPRSRRVRPVVLFSLAGLLLVGWARQPAHLAVSFGEMGHGRNDGRHDMWGAPFVERGAGFHLSAERRVHLGGGFGCIVGGAVAADVSRDLRRLVARGRAVGLDPFDCAR